MEYVLISKYQFTKMKKLNSNQTILIVDDTKENIEILLELLKNNDVIPAIDGNTALQIVKKEKIDLILLDIMMPIMDGFEVCRILKQDPKTAKIPIIFLSSKSTMEDMQIGFNLGAVDYITKPFNPLELEARVKTHLELKQYQDSLEDKVKEEIEKNRIKDQLLFQTSKQAEIGELLMHIAHQWKQPLSELGSINIYNIAKLKTTGDIDNETLLDSFEKTTRIIDFMADTMHTFQNYYKPDDKEENFHIYEAITEAINLISATYSYYHIKINIHKNFDPIIHGNKNEYSQVILSLLNNVKDIFLLRDIKQKQIDIKIEKGDKSIVSIKDNAGGIKLENIDDIFSPFVSDKNSFGMGLYMSRNIIEKQKGTISARNFENGAIFTIVL
ncbi:MAG: hybrid sensor histidine kinase/response regulator [Campylobacterota bacterium]|nr:hybrid sensor histidine kinase/response regulator [Campylobacterota bacterium]